ncbi:161 T antigen [Sus scrofa polyomavirus 1]|uniref:161 T antigen n=1 Tax=Sus scrofa polyomavirus 1 TaxID=1680894 RepID=A0A162GNA0_9POLY|nr:161 T antigen [Sus scrofa polyomavirus 1]AKQ44359.1 161 T antigen [Sus scrofa polyomavirus 1]
MDIALTREERKELSELLDLAPHCFGNIPMMKFCYRKACLRLHPDKGGDAGKMQRLNELWQTFQQSIDCLRNGENAGFYSFQDSAPPLPPRLGPLPPLPMERDLQRLQREVLMMEQVLSTLQEAFRARRRSLRRQKKMLFLLIFLLALLTISLTLYIVIKHV